MSELISRQMAIDESRNKTVSTNPDEFYAHDKFIKFQNNPEIVSYGRWQWANGFNTALVEEKIMLKKLPSAEKKGEWKFDPNDYDDSTWTCSVCTEPWTLIEGTPQDNNMNFCPNCGADMRGDENETTN